VRKLANQEGRYRLRLGAYRLVFEFDDAARRVIVLHAARRSEDTYRER
jgi:mRNA-degrading endonuclease RelE of RelBE toxin-antitoxin system